ncbi:hypothetical protein COX67_05165 [Candidatus Falkowbacteria bacterium CG_4_10_14_0_2_um_filter_36_22]|uniref:UmuC domain-containing protein n=1 Tax=Candidatus Falkowbacteria bacterium CG1_02_37_44 TaxID=1805146 RepID=A0A1J4T852_9BACT|nr:MAG: hypothetical protein AUJ27_02280 [Candidatus Falkowbacteria bacterium CG1_02_37_44]PJA10173.1 MAG: hypothetical protein COX67_05165 [Candidatus Falkowbacteria bacterium CG_4_10_14_0_2_um_filter_36_22]
MGYLPTEIQARIKKEAGEWLNSSVGISYTKFLVKFASDIAPKKSILIITKDNLDDCLKGRPLQDAWGINCRLEARLNALGIKNLYDLKKYSPSNIRRALGMYGYYLWANVNGLEIGKVEKGSRAPKSVGHSYCVPKQTKDINYVKSVFYKLTEKTGRRLWALGLEAERMHIALAYLCEGGISRSFKTPDKMFTTEEIFANLEKFLDNIEILMPVRMLAISVSALSPVSSQMAFFNDNLGLKELSRAVDKLNDRYGEYTIVKGKMFNTKDIAKDRIGFRKTISIKN